MASVAMTWSGSSSVSAAVAVNSDPVKTSNGAFSAVVQANGTSGGGLSGNLQLLVSADGITYVDLPGSVQSVDLADGQSLVYTLSGIAYEWAILQWVPGSLTGGTLTDGSWSVATGLLPVVGDFVPAVGTTIMPATPLAFEVTDPNGLGFAALVVVIAYPNGTTEVAFAGGQLTPLYVGGSSAAPISDGFAFSLKRAGGWPQSPTMTVYAVDLDGNANS